MFLFCLFLLRRGLGLPRLVIQHDLQYAAGPGVPKGPPGGFRGATGPRAAGSARRAWNVCTNHWHGWVKIVCALSLEESTGEKMAIKSTLAKYLLEMFTHIVLLIKSDWIQKAGTKWVCKSLNSLICVCSSPSNKSHLYRHYCSHWAPAPGPGNRRCLRSAYQTVSSSDFPFLFFFFF